jgi:hypothetical protein
MFSQSCRCHTPDCAFPRCPHCFSRCFSAAETLQTQRPFTVMHMKLSTSLVDDNQSGLHYMDDSCWKWQNCQPAPVWVDFSQLEYNAISPTRSISQETVSTQNSSSRSSTPHLSRPHSNNLSILPASSSNHTLRFFSPGEVSVRKEVSYRKSLFVAAKFADLCHSAEKRAESQSSTGVS